MLGSASDTVSNWLEAARWDFYFYAANICNLGGRILWKLLVACFIKSHTFFTSLHLTSLPLFTPASLPFTPSSLPFTLLHRSIQPISLLGFTILCLLATCFLLAHFLHTQFPWTQSVLPLSAVAILVGLLAGGVIELCSVSQANSFSSVDMISFDPIIFLVIQLPPIIFNSGFHVDGGMFLANLAPISIYAVLGTAISTISVAYLLNLVLNTFPLLSDDVQISFDELAAFGALISATDPVSTLAVFEEKKVDLQLFYLVFGESVINDAVGLVLFGTFSKIVKSDRDTFSLLSAACELFFVFCMSFLMGTLFSVVFAVIFRKIDFRHNQLAELSLFVMMMYFPFVCAEICGVSGIMTLLCTAMFSRRYVLPNLSDVTSNQVDAILRMISHISETSIFVILGISVFKVTKTTLLKWHIGFLFFTCAACLLARAVSVYSLSFLYNNLHHRCCCKWCSTSKSKKEQPQPQPQPEEYYWSNSNGNGSGGEEAEGKAEVVVDKVVRKGNNTPAPPRSSPLSSSQGQLILEGLSEEQSPEENIEAENINEDERNKVSISDGGHKDGSALNDSIILNTSHVDMKIQHMLVFAGLRGAVAFACASNFPDKNKHR